MTDGKRGGDVERVHRVRLSTRRMPAAGLAAGAVALAALLLAGCTPGSSAPAATTQGGTAASASYSQICVATQTMHRAPDTSCAAGGAAGATAAPGRPTTVPSPGYAWYFLRSDVRVPAVGAPVVAGPGASATFPDAGHVTVHDDIPAAGGYVHPDGTVSTTP